MSDTGKATPVITRFIVQVGLYGDEELRSIEGVTNRRGRIGLLFKHDDPNRDKLARELAEAVLLQHSPVGGIYGRAHDCIMCEQARQLLKLYEEV